MIERNDGAPRTYQSSWQWNEDGTAKLMTAEEWLQEESDVDAALALPAEDATLGFTRGGIMDAIAKEIAQLRAERTQWANECTRLAAEVSEWRAFRRKVLGPELDDKAIAYRDRLAAARRGPQQK